jgi:Tol biopolymer transport system component
MSPDPRESDAMSTVVERLNRALEGRYAIERELGEGGMATVFLARDLRHNRNVALKVLKPELAAVVGAERFLAEIETTANLQHPHILPLFDSGEADTFLFYVMPYVTGETLRDRIDREKQLPVDEALGIATSAASALQHAHDRGVIHRDIKPGNIMLQDGQPVVGDFGIALAVGAAGGTRLTETGLSVGTPYYMSPEQATGDQAVGPASDIYALACVLYEMLVGEPPYPGTTAQAVLGKIIQGIPVSATAIRRSVPANVDAAIRRALEKLPADRFTSAQGFAKALGDPGFRHGEDPAAAVAPARLRRIAIAGWATAAAAVAALVVGAMLPTPQPVRRVERFAAPFLEGQEPEYLGPNGYDLSPDGSMLVYRRGPPGGQSLLARRWDDLAATPIRETENARDPAVSPDGLQLAFEQDEQIKVLAFSGGPVRTLTEGITPEWGPDGFVYASTDSGTVRVPASGGAIEVVSRLADGEDVHVVYDVLPGAEEALMMVLESDEDVWEIRGLDLETGEMKSLVEGQRPRFAPTGHLLYSANDGTLMAARFDPDRMELLGQPVALMDGIGYWSVSDDGKLFYTAGVGTSGGPTLQFLWVTREGRATPVDPSWSVQRGTDVNVGWSISPDGSMMAVREYTSEGYDIWVKQLDTGPRSRLTFGDSEERMPVWKPGTREVTFLSDRNGNLDVWSRPADGTQEPELILDIEDVIATADWTPDGEWLLVRTSTGSAATSQRNVLAFRPSVDSVPTPLFAGSYREISPAVSPDGHWIAYASDETGRYEIYVRPFPDVDRRRWQVSIDGGRRPRWAHSGRELFFQSPENAMLAVPIENGGDFAYGTPSVLFEAESPWYVSNLSGLVYEVAPDDQRFLIATTQPGGSTADSDAPLPPATVLVNNFFEELERAVPE